MAHAHFPKVSRPTVPRWLRAFAFLLFGALAACGTQQPAYSLQDIGGLMPRLKFDLTNQDGAQVTAEDYRSHVVLLYFGFTQCPDVCPTTLATLGRALRELGASASNVRVLFVSVDPQRDSAAVLKRYVSAFGPQFVGLSGDDAALTALAKRYRVAYSREKADANGFYAVSHSSAVFIFQGDGTPRLLARADASAEAIAGDLRKLIARDVDSHGT